MLTEHASPDLYLASSSPRRCELLRQIGVDFATVTAAVDETPLDGEAPCNYVERLALAKARAGWSYSSTAARRPVLGADTTVVCDGINMGKPSDMADAVAMLMRLSGRTHPVISAVAVVQGERSATRVVITEVRFRELSVVECEAYWETGEPVDKAGAYGIQGYAAVFVEAISGSYSNVVGLPLLETAELLAEFSVPIWHGTAV